ncbi:MAG: hypothetical protein QM778_01885 [Myxococcales bacterium]
MSSGARAARCAFGGLLLAVFMCFQAESAHAERVEKLLLGPELRLRPSRGLFEAPREELALPHGVSTAHSDLVARVGVVLAERSSELAFPISLGMRYLPFDSPVRPLLGVDLGGYFSQTRGPRAQGAPSGLAWTWSARGLLGAELRATPWLALRVYADAMWAQTPASFAMRDQVFSGLGAGAELVFRWAPPRWKLVDMVLRGDDAPKEW